MADRVGGADPWADVKVVSRIGGAQPRSPEASGTGTAKASSSTDQEEPQLPPNAPGELVGMRPGTLPGLARDTTASAKGETGRAVDLPRGN